MISSIQLDNIPKWPYADEMEEKALHDTLYANSWWRNAGGQVKAFEKEFAEFHECKGGFAVANGTTALEIALKALGIGEGDEVIVPDFTFYSTVSSVLAVKAIPVLVDVKEDDFNINPVEIKKGITEKTKAIIPVHIAGHVADMDTIMEIARENHLFVIEDASHAHGAVWRGKKVGSFGTVSTFSFQNAKLMTSGEGGIVLSNDTVLLHRVLLEANCGRNEGDTNYQHVLIGTNSRLSEFQGAVLRVQLSRLEEQIALREKNYRYLCECMNNIPGIVLQNTDEGMMIHPHYMVMFYYDKNAFHNASRDEFVQYLKNAGIPANRSYESIHKLPVFEKLDKNAWRLVANSQYDNNLHCVHSEKISNEVVCLNHNILLGDDSLIESIVNVIKDFNNK